MCVSTDGQMAKILNKLNCFFHRERKINNFYLSMVPLFWGGRAFGSTKQVSYFLLISRN